MKIQQKKSDPKKDKMLQLSVSSIDTFNMCKAKWYYDYIERLPKPKSYHLTAGSFIHKILEIFLRRYKKSNDLRDAAKVAYSLAQKDQYIAPDLTEEIRKEAKAWLKELVQKYEKQPELIPNVLKIETPFNFKLLVDTDVEILIRGFIDRVDQIDENTIEIIDYKTNSNPDYLKPLQLVVYAIALEKKYPGKIIKGAYQLIRHQHDKKQVEISEEAKQKALDTFKKVALEIKELMKDKPNTCWETTHSKLCSYCPFRIRCETDNASSNKWQV